jgi:two-component system response regulator NreC
MPIKCIVVDDHTLFRDGVRRLLDGEVDIEVIGEASDAVEALEKIRSLLPDVVLMDIGMPGMSSFEAARLIERNCPNTRTIFLTMYEDEEYLLQCLEVGAAGYVLKRIMEKLVEDFHARPRGPQSRVSRGSTLTPREREVIKMLAEGNSVKEIAKLLGLSVKTVEAHKFNLMRKLNIHNKAQLVTYAIQKKILKMPAGA